MKKTEEGENTDEEVLEEELIALSQGKHYCCCSHSNIYCSNVESIVYCVA